MTNEILQQAKTLTLIRGLPGSGKTTLAKALCKPGDLIAEANDYFMQEGEYVWDNSKVRDSYDYCIDKVAEAMQSGVPNIYVPNTFAKEVHMLPYIRLAAQYGYKVNTLICTTYFSNVHNVKGGTLRKMRSDFEWPMIALPTV